MIASCSGKYNQVSKVIKDKALASCVIEVLKSENIAALENVTKVICQNGVSDLTG